MVRQVRLVPSVEFQSLMTHCTAELSAQDAAPACDGAPEPVPLFPENVVPTPPWAVQLVAEMPQNSAELVGRFRLTLIPVAVAPTAPVQQYAADWFDPPAVCDARDVHVTLPPEAVGVTEVKVAADSTEHKTTIRSPEVTLNVVVVNDAGLLL